MATAGGKHHRHHHVADSEDLQILLAMNGHSKGLNKASRRGGQTIATRTILFLTLATAFLFGYVSIWRVHTRVIPARSTERRSRDDAPSLDESRGRKADASDEHQSALESIKQSVSDTVESIGEKVESLLPISMSADPRPKLQLSKKRNRVYCFVPFIWTPPALKAYHAIEATWGKRCDTLRFFIDPIIGDEEVGFYNMTEPSGVVEAREKANLTLPDDVVVLHSIRRPWHMCSGGNMKQFGNCRNIFEKVSFGRSLVVLLFGNLKELNLSPRRYGERGSTSLGVLEGRTSGKGLTTVPRRTRFAPSGSSRLTATLGSSPRTSTTTSPRGTGRTTSSTTSATFSTTGRMTGALASSPVRLFYLAERLS